MEAAISVRDQHSRTTQVRDLHHTGSHYADRIAFEAEMVVPGKAIDDLGQEARASITFLRYSLELAYRESNDHLERGALEIVKEELVHVAQRDAPRHLLFPHSAKDWRKSVVTGRRTAHYFISTEGGRQSHKAASGWRQQRTPVAAAGRQSAAHRVVGSQCRGEPHGIGCAPGNGVMAVGATGTVSHAAAGRVCFSHPSGSRRASSGSDAVPLGAQFRTGAARPQPLGANLIVRSPTACANSSTTYMTSPSISTKSESS